MNAPAAALHDLLRVLGLGTIPCTGEIGGDDPVVASRFRLGAAAAAALAAQGTAVAEIWRLRGGRAQRVFVDAGRAVVPGLYTLAAVRQNGHPVVLSYGLNPAGFFRTRDGRWVYLVGSLYRTPELEATLTVLECGNTPASLTGAVAAWEGEELEAALAERGLPIGALVRTAEEWRAHPQGRWLAEQPVVAIEKIADSAPEPFLPAPRPLAGLRVLDMTQVLAGPVAGRMFAEQGAEVLQLYPPNRAYRIVMNLDTEIGKRSAFIDLERPDAVASVRSLASKADVFLQAWRPGSFDRRGLSAQFLAQQRPGLVYVSVSCYGSAGPWATRGGYDPLAQSVTGIAAQEGSASAPKLAPTGSLTGYLTGYLAAAGTLAALIRRAREGGSYHVKVSLARTAMWVQSLGTVDAAALLAAREIDPAHLMTMDSAYGSLRFAAPITQYSETHAYWEKGPEPLGASIPAWRMRDRARS